MNNINEHENIITEEHKARHDIKKYNFRNMEVNPKPAVQTTHKETIQDSIPKNNEIQEQKEIQEMQPQQKTIQNQPQINTPSLKLFETEAVDKIHQKSNE